ncbi:MAG: hypothetical protein JJV88_01545 [Sulfurovum sp.]|nr:hypothetical protein [Sulfurovaceae bacterium]
MAQLKGSAVQGILGFETSFGVPAVDGNKIAFNPDLSANSERAINKSNEITGSRSPQQGFQGFENGKFGGSFRVDTKQFPIFLKGLFGSPTSVDNTDGTHTHTFKIADNVPSMFFEQNHTDATGGLFYMTKGIGLNTMGLSFAGDDELTVSIEGVAQTTSKDIVTAMTGTVTDVTDGEKFMKFTSAVTGGGKVSDLAINYSNEITADDSRYLNGTGQIGGIPAGIASVNGTITALMEDDDLFQKARDFDTLAITNTITNGVNSIKFEMQEVKASGKSSPDVNTPNGLKVDGLAYEAFYKSGTNASALTIIVVNEFATV